ncbi:hypothetical protein ACJ41O_014421 [Fusarium nematophilum]
MHLVLFILSLLSLGQALLLPKPSGPFSVARRIHTLTDNDRLDPYSKNHEKRRVLASIFWPVDPKSCSSQLVSYMPPATAEAYGRAAAQMGLSNDTFKSLEMEVCRVSSAAACGNSASRRTSFPVAVFSPGAGNSRLRYSAMAMSLSSYGHVVILIDHPYDAEIVEFPDGTIIPAADIPEDTENLEKATKVRAEDISFVISQIQEPSFQKKVKGLPGKIDTKRVVALGHSMGGASAAAAMLLDSRIRGGMNLDGRLFDPVLGKGLDRPFMQLGRPGHHSQDSTWVEFWKKLRGPKVELDMSGTVHGSFTDFPLILGALGLPSDVIKTLEPLVGSVDGEDLQEIISKTLSAFIGYVLEGEKAPLLKTIKGSRGLSIVKSWFPAKYFLV